MPADSASARRCHAHKPVAAESSGLCNRRPPTASASRPASATACVADMLPPSAQPQLLRRWAVNTLCTLALPPVGRRSSCHSVGFHHSGRDSARPASRIPSAMPPHRPGSLIVTTALRRLAAGLVALLAVLAFAPVASMAQEEAPERSRRRRRRRMQTSRPSASSCASSPRAISRPSTSTTRTAASSASTSIWPAPSAWS